MVYTHSVCLLSCTAYSINVTVLNELVLILNYQANWRVTWTLYANILNRWFLYFRRLLLSRLESFNMFLNGVVWQFLVLFLFTVVSSKYVQGKV